jgi:hypothetical protein
MPTLIIALFGSGSASLGKHTYARTDNSKDKAQSPDLFVRCHHNGVLGNR